MFQQPMPQTKIDVQDTDLSSILNILGSGHLQVPRFQREFVWPLTKTRKLLDSMYKEFPIGTFFLWRSPLDTPHLIRELKEIGIPDPPEGQPISYILDGQQRLASLFCVITGQRIGKRDYGRISINLEVATRFMQSDEEEFSEDIFVYRTGDNRQYVCVKDILGSQNLEIYDNIPKEWRDAYKKLEVMLKTYPFSVVWVRDQKLGNAIEIFTRINQAGKPLSRFDLVSANVWRDDFDFRKKIEEINRKYQSVGFGKIDETIYTQAFALILKDKCTTAAELDLKTDEIMQNWEKVIRALNLAVDHCVTNFGVKRIDFLPYRGLLVLLTYFFFHKKEATSTADRKILWQYFWRTTLSDRYSSTSPTKMADDAVILKKYLSGEKVEFDYTATVNKSAVLRTKMTSTSSVLRNATLCLLALKTPLNFKDNMKVNLGDEFFSDLKKAERHHIFPIGFLKTKPIDPSQVHLLPNFCFIPANLNKEIGDQAPSKYLPLMQTANPKLAQALDTHLIPHDKEYSLLMNDEGFYDFLEARADLLANELNKLVNEIPPDLKTVPEPLPFSNEVDVLEIRIRDFIDDRLVKIMGRGYLKDAFPSDVIEAGKKKIDEFVSFHPYEDRAQFTEGRKFLDYLDIPHYEKIILVSWDHFSSYFGRKDEFQRHMSALRALRNCIQHNRKPSDIEAKNGEAALLWLSRSIDVYDQEIEAEELNQENGYEAQDIETIEGLE